MMREGIATAVPNRAAIILSVLALLAFAGCSGSELRGTDADTGVFADGGAPADGGPTDFAGGRSSGDPVFGADADEASGGEPSADAGMVGAFPPGFEACVGAGGTADGTYDCNNPACADLGSCRIGSGQLCTVRPAVGLYTDGCDGDSLTAACLGEAGAVFGSPTPWVAGGGIHPGGRDFDSGFYLDGARGLRSERLKLEGTFAAPACKGEVTCRENVAFGVTGRTEFDNSTRVRAAAALEYRAARDEVALLLEDVTVFARDFNASEPNWALELTPDGRAHVWNQGAVVESFDYAPQDDLRVVVYGRSVNRGSDFPVGARLSGLSSESAACDIPDAWTERGEVGLVRASGGSPYDAQRPSGASVATRPISAENDTPRRWMAFHQLDAEGVSQIMGAFETSGLEEFKIAHLATEQLLGPGQGHQSVAVRDPEIVWDEDNGLWHLYYTAEGPEDALSIGHAQGPALTDLTADEAPLITPGGWLDLTALEMPTVAVAADGRRVVVVRATMDDGSHRLVGFVESWDLGDFIRITGRLGAMTTRDDGTARTGFAADEVAQPSLINWDGAFHLYYAGRRGTRWAIGLLASEDFLTFRNVAPTTPILSGDNVGFDALGVRGIDIEIVDGFAVAIYEGTDGFETGIGYARRPTPAVAAP